MYFTQDLTSGNHFSILVTVNIDLDPNSIIFNNKHCLHRSYLYSKLHHNISFLTLVIRQKLFFFFLFLVIVTLNPLSIPNAVFIEATYAANFITISQSSLKFLSVIFFSIFINSDLTSFKVELDLYLVMSHLCTKTGTHKNWMTHRLTSLLLYTSSNFVCGGIKRNFHFLINSIIILMDNLRHISIKIIVKLIVKIKWIQVHFQEIKETVEKFAWSIFLFALILSVWNLTLIISWTSKLNTEKCITYYCHISLTFIFSIKLLLEKDLSSATGTY